MVVSASVNVNQKLFSREIVFEMAPEKSDNFVKTSMCQNPFYIHHVYVSYPMVYIRACDLANI